MKILLHAPLHPSYWVYLLETMPEHEWFIEPKEDFEQGSTPRKHIKYTIVPRKSNIKYDVQIICISSHGGYIKPLLQDFHIPIVFVDFWRTPIPELAIKYPLISGCCHLSNETYPNNQYVYIPPSRTLWNQDWKGDIQKVFIPGQAYLHPSYVHTFFAKLIKNLQKTDLALALIEDSNRQIPWSQWQDYFIHNRVLLDCADKRCSFVIEEAMTIGMPIISREAYETPWQIRDKVDGFTKWSDNELIELLHKFTEKDNSFATEWSLKSKERGKEILSVAKTRECFNKAFEDAIKLFNSSKNPFELNLVTKPITTPIPKPVVKPIIQKFCPVCGKELIKTIKEGDYLTIIDLHCPCGYSEKTEIRRY